MIKLTEETESAVELLGVAEKAWIAGGFMYALCMAFRVTAIDCKFAEIAVDANGIRQGNVGRWN